MQVLTFDVLGRGVRVACADPAARSLLSAAYGAMRGEPGATDLDYTVRGQDAPAGFRIERPAGEALTAADEGTLLALLDAEIAIEIQKLRRDLYFVHAAVLRHGDGAVMLVARSGGGKSTLSWALLHHGFGYLSDELGPVDLARLDVHAYPRALMMKRDPPASYPLAGAGVWTSRGVHIPAADMPGPLRPGPAPLAAIFFLERQAQARQPSVRRISAAEAAARLYANTLNALAHGGDGVDGALRIAAARPCFHLVATDLGPTCALVTATLQRPG